MRRRTALDQDHLLLSADDSKELTSQMFTASGMEGGIRADKSGRRPPYPPYPVEVKNFLASVARHLR
jgi:hypothetical protein